MLLSGSTIHQAFNMGEKKRKNENEFLLWTNLDLVSSLMSGIVTLDILSLRALIFLTLQGGHCED